MSRLLDGRQAGRLLRAIRPAIRPSPYRGGVPETILVLTPGRFGDVILRTPLIGALRRISPRSDITVAGKGPGIDLLGYDERVDRVVNLKSAGRSARADLRRRAYDVLLNTRDHSSFTTGRLVQRLDVAYRIGIDHRDNEGLYDCLVRCPGTAPVWEKAAAVADPLAGDRAPAPRSRPRLPPGPISTNVADFVESWAEGVRPVVVNLSASASIRRPPADFWHALLEGVGAPLVFVAGPEDVEAKAALEARLVNALRSPPTATLFDVGHLIRGAAALVSPDTAAVHIASCFNTPTLALYRCREDVERFPPLADLAEIAVADSEDIGSLRAADVRGPLERILATSSGG